MEEWIMKNFFLFGVSAFLSMLLSLSTYSYAANYDHEIKVQKMVLGWKVEGANVAIKISAPTKGWVGIGFNPSSEMKDARYVLGYVQNGKVTLSEDFGTGTTKHETMESLGGKSDVTLIGGTEEGDITTIEFVLPLISTDTKGKKIDPEADTEVLLAYGPDTDSFKIKHKYRTSIRLNLTTGKYK
jgi:hypothetical protein